MNPVWKGDSCKQLRNGSHHHNHVGTDGLNLADWPFKLTKSWICAFIPYLLEMSLGV